MWTTTERTTPDDIRVACTWRRRADPLRVLARELQAIVLCLTGKVQRWVLQGHAEIADGSVLLSGLHAGCMVTCSCLNLTHVEALLCVVVSPLINKP